MKINKFFENEDVEGTYLDKLKKEKEERESESSMVSRRKGLVSSVTDAILKSEKTKDKLFLDELESLLAKHGF
jgi:hypothetical protein